MRTIELRGNEVILIDQTQLPQRLVRVRCRSAGEVAAAIEGMKIRGAPALAAAAAMALAVTALRSRARTKERLLRELESAGRRIGRTRPTAVNLFVGLERALSAARAAPDVASARAAVVQEAKNIAEEDVRVNRRIGENGAALLDVGDVVLTHCNAGSLATVDYGTALGVIRAAHRAGKKIKVIATETRPLLQGARLTAWELRREKIPVTVVTDGMVGYLMAKGMVDKVVVGADRIAANGDAANKIGTYSIAVLAKEHGVPFYIAAPLSTFDPNLKTGAEIPIEERRPEEVIFFRGVRVVPKGVSVFNPAFDVTPARYITAFITEKGVVKPGELSKLFKS
ncbi:MAG: methylthioribose-1-phosphate isomerase [Candidatus Hadarchaeum yellowstonense]|uniref:Putative methylthioribose-1-phosphate isomerase n=1 Tax=Hadarchaeum yellowstonense TaxID=1776334 RepID=A0A147JTA4_HADYE|nr:MAG: methylthioribose-1-phosphate isomerase [Candidatus Hadarchaeum yellowstonense]